MKPTKFVNCTVNSTGIGIIIGEPKGGTVQANTEDKGIGRRVTLPDISPMYRIPRDGSDADAPQTYVGLVFGVVTCGALLIWAAFAMGVRL